MPINKEAYLRYKIIDECIRNKYHPYPAMEDLIDACEGKLGKTFSESTIQKDIKAMREDELLGYKAPVKYSRSHMGYYYTDPNFTIASIPINEQDINSMEFAAFMLQSIKGNPLLTNFSHAVDKIFAAINLSSSLDEEQDDIIQFEEVPFFQGSEFLSELLDLIQNRKVIEFSYQRFGSENVKRYMVHPYLLKEYKNRWYLIGMENERKQIRTFGLDRISSIEARDLTYEYKSDFNTDEYFKHSFGITVFKGKPKAVILKFDPQQGNYIKTQPLHRSQIILKDNDDEFVVEYKVGISIELIQTIMSYGPKVEVLKPEELRDEINKALGNALKRYK
ncbi:MAG: WYL domain-containing protein [Chitinophagales bacterium]|nr:WYL domain-containing protein [Chitinophagales bacterium]